MLLVKPSVEILFITPCALGLIEVAGRTCYKSESNITAESASKFAEAILKRGHESVIEHASATARFVCDRGVTHEIVRHRLASYSQESTRYCDYTGGNIAFVIPVWFADVQPGFYDTRSVDVRAATAPTSTLLWLKTMLETENTYKRLRTCGWKPEQARSVLPNSLKTEIVMTANLREWRHFFKLRTSAAAHPQMREVAAQLLNKMQHQIPVIFDDIAITGKP